MITIIDYKLSNLDSVKNALDKLGVESKITSDPSVIAEAEGIILPGVGSANQGMANLKECRLDEVISVQIRQGKPFLGICLGMQLLFSVSEEGSTKCLGVLRGKVKRFESKVKVPQIGWNSVNMRRKSFLFEQIPTGSYFYFVNSFYCIPDDKSVTCASTSYGEDFSSVIIKNNTVGVQFHPEKSGAVGFQLLKNFIHFSKNYDN